jgi:hypothetical protein
MQYAAKSRRLASFPSCSKGIGIRGQLGRTADMTNQPMDANGDYDLGLTKFYGKTVQCFDSQENK